jgi:hypothetical protein
MSSFQNQAPIYKNPAPALEKQTHNPYINISIISLLGDLN